MKIEDYKIGNIYMGNKAFVLDLNTFSLVISHYYTTKKCRYDPVQIDLPKLRALGFKAKSGNELTLLVNNKHFYTLEFYKYDVYAVWLNGKSLLKIQYIHELQDIVRLFSKHELELK